MDFAKSNIYNFFHTVMQSCDHDNINTILLLGYRNIDNILATLVCNVDCFLSPGLGLSEWTNSR